MNKEGLIILDIQPEDLEGANTIKVNPEDVTSQTPKPIDTFNLTPGLTKSEATVEDVEGILRQIQEDEVVDEK